MNKFIKHFLLLTALFSVIFIIHFFIFSQFNIRLFYPIWSVYLFHYTISIILFSAIYKVNTLLENYTGFAFLAGTTLQMLLCILFFIPLIESHFNEKIWDIFSFFIPYFISLIYTAFFSIRLLFKRNESSEIKN